MDNITKDQIITYMVDCLGYSENQDELNQKSRVELLLMLDFNEQMDCIAFNQ